MGEAAQSFGFNAQATGHWSTAMINNSIASGNASFSAGDACRSTQIACATWGRLTRAIGYYSTAFGNNTRAKSLCTFALGRHNDSTAVETQNWNLNDPLFIVGNGSSSASRANAMTILKNGNVGLFEMSPNFRLHLTNNNADAGGILEGILIENTHSLVGEAGLSFLNKSIPASRKWIIGQNQSQTLDFNFYNSFVVDGLRMRMDTHGFIGIQKFVPEGPLHVVRNAPSGGPYSPNGGYLFDSNVTSYLQLSSLNQHETGMLSGNQSGGMRSAIRFSADSSILFDAGGDINRLSIVDNGNVVIGSSGSQEKLSVAGNSKLGTNGTPFEQMMKYTFNYDIPLLLAGDTFAFSFQVDDVALGGTVFISPSASLPEGLIINSIVTSDDFITFSFFNESSGTINPGAMDFYIVHMY
jgi:hypothetical protein